MKRLLFLLLFLVSTLACAQTSPSYLQIRGTPLASVDRYGAKGDGVTDDSAAFTAAAIAGKGGISLTRGKTYKAGLRLSGDATAGALYAGSDRFTVEGNGASLVADTSAATSYGINYGYYRGFFNLNKFNSVVIKDLKVTGTYFNGYVAANTPPYTDTAIGQQSFLSGRYLKNLNISNIIASQVPQLLYISDVEGGSIRDSQITYCEYGASMFRMKDVVLDNVDVYHARIMTSGAYPMGGSTVGEWTVESAAGTVYAFAGRQGGYGLVFEDPYNVTARNCLVYGAYSQSFRSQGSAGHGLLLDNCTSVLAARYGFAIYGTSSGITWNNCKTYDYDPLAPTTTYATFWSGEPPATIGEAQAAATYADPTTSWMSKYPSSSPTAFNPRITRTIMTGCKSYSYLDRPVAARTRWLASSLGNGILNGTGLASAIQHTTAELVLNGFTSIGPADYAVLDLRSASDTFLSNVVVDIATASLATGNTSFPIRCAAGMGNLVIQDSSFKGGYHSIYYEAATAVNALIRNCSFSGDSLQAAIRVTGTAADRNLKLKNCEFPDVYMIRMDVTGQGPFEFQDCVFNKTKFVHPDSADGAYLLTGVRVFEGAEQVIWGSAAAIASESYTAWFVPKGDGVLNVRFNRFNYNGSDYDTSQATNFPVSRPSYGSVEGTVSAATMTTIASPSLALKATLSSGGSNYTQVYFVFPALNGWWYAYVAKN